VSARASRSPATRPGYLAGRTPANAGRTYPAEILTPAEVRALMHACSSRAPTGVRNRALLAILYRGGLRLSEALALYPKDLDAGAGAVSVLHGKGDKRRTIGLDPGAFAIVERWLWKRAKIGIGPRRPLFCTLDGRRLDDSYVRRLMRRLGERCEIDKHVHPHALRHTHAFELANEAIPVHVIQQQLGHGSLASTDRYLRHIAPHQLIEVMRGREWDLSGSPSRTTEGGSQAAQGEADPRSGNRRPTFRARSGPPRGAKPLSGLLGPTSQGS
jgi:site-specific recombinase XerD